MNQLGGGLKHFLCLPLLGDMIQFDEHIFSNGLVQPPTSSILQQVAGISFATSVNIPQKLSPQWRKNRPRFCIRHNYRWWAPRLVVNGVRGPI